jgi:hypothetical protein
MMNAPAMRELSPLRSGEADLIGFTGFALIGRIDAQTVAEPKVLSDPEGNTRRTTSLRIHPECRSRISFAARPKFACIRS